MTPFSPTAEICVRFSASLIACRTGSRLSGYCETFGSSTLIAPRSSTTLLWLGSRLVKGFTPAASFRLAQLMPPVSSAARTPLWLSNAWYWTVPILGSFACQ